ncbi:MAG: hypothetical protein JJT77_13915, partial [Crocinitomicaceae bacterium]|nr:hypothetical protein [Crocinitomicaceae bacterium]
YDWKTACKVCPDGWHLPSYAEWTRLIDYLGGEDLAGYKMKSKSGWKNGGNGSDLSGFSGHPSGLVDEYNEFYFEGEYGIWWLNKENNQKTANNISFNNVNSYVFFHDEIDKQFGFSVRCIKE